MFVSNAKEDWTKKSILSKLIGSSICPLAFCDILARYSVMLIQQKLVLHINPLISASRNRGELRLLFSEVGTTDSSD